ncbi:MAG: DUF883 family protein [Betaproteobacteria bacterium]
MVNTTASDPGAMEGDLRKVLNDAEGLLQQAAASGGEKAIELRDRAIEQLKAARDRLQDINEAALERGRQAARATDDYVHEHPWRAIATAAGVGLLVGMLIARR